MNLRNFLRYHQVTFEEGNTSIPASIRKRVDDDFAFLIDHLGGKTFGHGVYRVFRGDQIAEATENICELFEAAKGTAVAFATDWLGRHFVLDSSEQKLGKATVVCLEPGVPDSFCTDQTIVNFHNETLVKEPNAALAAALFKTWRQKFKKAIPPDQCVGYKVPLFLGGSDDIPNLKLMNRDVYVHLCVQLWKKVKDLPEGTPIGDISID